MKNLPLILGMALLLGLFFFFIIPMAFDPGMSNNPPSSVNFCNGFMYFHHVSHSIASEKLALTMVNGRENVTIQEIFINDMRGSNIIVTPSSLAPNKNFEVSADFPGLNLDRTRNFNLRIIYDAPNGNGSQEFAVCSP